MVLANAAVNDSVGGTASGVGNVIADNAQSGVLIGASSTETTTHSAVQQNVIFANGGLGIDLAPQGVVNCTTPPPGPNDNTPCPVIQSATTTQVRGTACSNCSVDVFSASNEADDQGHGEGQIFLGRATADTTGAWSLILTPGQIATGQQVTATGDDASRLRGGGRDIRVRGQLSHEVGTWLAPRQTAIQSRRTAQVSYGLSKEDDIIALVSHLRISHRALLFRLAPIHGKVQLGSGRPSFSAGAKKTRMTRSSTMLWKR